MTSLIKKIALGTTMLASAISFGAKAQNNMDDVTIEVQELRGGIYALFGRGGNIGASIGEDGIFLIDDQFAPLTDKIKAALAGISDQPVKFVINTHWHGDHTGGNENLGKEGSIIVAHDNVRVRMKASDMDRVAKGEMDMIRKDALPVITFNDELSFHLNGTEARSIHISNAHTDGDSIIHFAEYNIVHMGDTFFNGRFPFIDVNSGGSVDGALNAIDAVLTLSNDDTMIIPGHGPIANKGDLQAYRDMIQTVRDRVAEMKGNGMSLEQVNAAGPANDYAEKWSWNFISAERFVGAIYSSL